MIAHHHAKAIQAIENAELVGIYGRNGQNAKKCADIYQVGYSDDLNAFLKDQSLDIVTIASPSGCHMEHSIAAMQSGIHVICEKPLEITPTRIDRMIESAEKNNVILSGIFNRRFNPAFDLLKKAVVAGRFGRITMVDAQIKWYRDQDYYDSGKWRGTWELDGGGALMNQSIHTIDQMQALVGKVKRISASVDCLIHERIEVEDAAVAIIEFENGARGVIQASTACWSKEGHPAEIQICGEKGSVFLMDEKFRS